MTQPMTQRPNILLIMTDQQRADLCRREGYPLDTMPFVDSLAAGGTWFDRAYTTMPACVPARVSMLTGRYPQATRVRCNMNAGDATYATDMMQTFRAAGYATALCGKNHSYLTPKDVDYWFHAGHVGADDTKASLLHSEFDALAGKMHMHLHTEPVPFPAEAQLPYRTVTHAQDIIRGLDGKPFLMWMSFAEPHNPYQVPEPYYSMFPPESLPPLGAGPGTLAKKGFAWEWCRASFERAFGDYARTLDRARANYHGLIRLIDDQVKRMVGFLDAHGLRENTLVVFLSDHGDFAGEYGLLRKGPQLPETLTRIPMVFNGPGVKGHSGPHVAHVSIADLFPTLCEAAGLPIPEGVQGRSLWPLLTGHDDAPDQFASAYAEHGVGGLKYVGGENVDPKTDGMRAAEGEAWGGYDCLNSRTQCGFTRMVRKGDWKLVFDGEGHRRLYNLAADPLELNDLYGVAEHAAVRTDMLEELATWMIRTSDTLPLPRRGGTRQYQTKRGPHNFWRNTEGVDARKDLDRWLMALSGASKTPAPLPATPP